MYLCNGISASYGFSISFSLGMTTLVSIMASSVYTAIGFPLGHRVSIGFPLSPHHCQILLSFDIFFLSIVF